MCVMHTAVFRRDTVLQRYIAMINDHRRRTVRIIFDTAADNSLVCFGIRQALTTELSSNRMVLVYMEWFDV